MKPIAIDDFCAVRSLANVTFSPEGTSACFTVSQAKKEKNCYESRLYLLKGGRVRALTGGGKESSFCYLDENTVLFAGDREEVKEPCFHPSSRRNHLSRAASTRSRLTAARPILPTRFPSPSRRSSLSKTATCLSSARPFPALRTSIKATGNS